MKLGGREMRGLAILAAILSITVSANAGMFINVTDEDGFLMPSETTVIQIVSDSLPETGTYYFGVFMDCPGTLDLSGVITPYPDLIEPAIVPDPIIGELLGLKEPVLEFDIWYLNPPIYWGVIVDNIILHCDDVGDVTMGLFNGDGELLDTAVIHQIPEPATIALLGLGMLMLKRKR